jgi:DNA-binding response OmpR family regulator
MSKAKHLLIVDDDRNARDGYRLYLSSKGFEVLAVSGGADALEFVKRAIPDLVVLDLGLPDIDGWEVARRLKNSDETSSVPIIAFSGRSMQHEQVSALRAGCDLYLTKPCAPEKLLTAIHKLLGMEGRAQDREEQQPDPY